MKKKVISSIKKVILLSLLLFIGYSCSDSTQDYLDEYEIRRMIEEEIRKNNQDLEFTQWKIVDIPTKKSHWEWFDDVMRYEAVYDLPDLDDFKFIYESGAQIGYILIEEQGGNNVQKMLPYVHTHYEKNAQGDPILDNQGNLIVYTETISCDYHLGSPNTVAFYIQTSDLVRNDDYLDDYKFRIVLVW